MQPIQEKLRQHVTRGDISYEFFFPSGDMSNLAYIGATNLNLFSYKNMPTLIESTLFESTLFEGLL